jgi:hypothetical protein
MRDGYADAARKYLPERGTKVLFVAEAPPNSIERYFYFADVVRHDWLWIGLMKSLYPCRWTIARAERKNKRAWLTRFQRSGFQLIDALKHPVSGRERHRVSEIKNNADGMLQEIKAINPQKIVLIKKTVYDALFERLRTEGLPVANQGAIPFPSSGRQVEFHNAITVLRLQEDSQ